VEIHTTKVKTDEYGEPFYIVHESGSIRKPVIILDESQAFNLWSQLCEYFMDCETYNEMILDKVKEENEKDK